MLLRQATVHVLSDAVVATQLTKLAHVPNVSCHEFCLKAWLVYRLTQPQALTMSAGVYGLACCCDW